MTVASASISGSGCRHCLRSGGCQVAPVDRRRGVLGDRPDGRGGALRIGGIGDDSVIACHPIGQDVIDARILNHARGAAGQLEGIHLPQKIGRRAQGYRCRGTSLVTAHRHCLGKVDIEIPPRPLQPIVQQSDRLGVARGIRPIEGRGRSD